ncbi:uncharacterized protein LOC125546839 [Triticum urartu]|uniref:uncharacterized protein LOC125546839 n=1 Tax=Triticum urartu TaxID=4572 RepID=UPI002043674B|nr:uncharacterized protein LOC125546839 [Triticum urartu]
MVYTIHPAVMDDYINNIEQFFAGDNYKVVNIDLQVWGSTKQDSLIELASDIIDPYYEKMKQDAQRISPAITRPSQPLLLVSRSQKKGEHGMAEQLQPARRRRGRRDIHRRRRRRLLRRKEAEAAWLRAAAQAQSLVVLQLLGYLLDHISPYGHHYVVRDRSRVWWTGGHGVWLADCRHLHHHRRPSDGRDLFCLPYIRRTLLLECQALQRAMLGPLRLLAHRLPDEDNHIVNVHQGMKAGTSALQTVTRCPCPQP